MNEIVQSISILTIIGLLAGLILVAAYSKLKVKEDDRVVKIKEILPGVNCGACGYASCQEYAIAVCMKNESADLCKVGGIGLSAKISEITGSGSGSSDTARKKAVVHCGVKTRKILAEYLGPASCEASNILGGGLACKYGCLGHGDCRTVCPFDAITMNENSVPVIDLKLCTGCGLCVKECPRNIISLAEQGEDGRIVYISCSNRQSGKVTRSVCSDGCIACKICEKKGPENMFKIEDDLSAVMFYKPSFAVADIKCPTKCICENSEEIQTV